MASSRQGISRGEENPLGGLSEPLLSAAEVAELLGVRPSSVYEYARTRQLPHVRIGRHVRFVRSDLESWLTTRRR